MGSDDVPKPNRRVATVAAVLVLVVGVAVVAVVVRDGTDDGKAVRAEPSSSSSPFLVEEVPDGYHLTRIGPGTAPPSFGNDFEYAIEPFTLLSADGTPEGADLLAVSYTLGSGDYSIETQHREGGSEPDSLGIEGKRGTFASGLDWADLTLRRTIDVWVRVSSATDRRREELIAIAEQVPVPDVADRSFAPVVSDGFAGLKVVGSVDAHVIESQWPLAYRELPLSPEGAHVVAFTGPTEDDRLVVRTLPGRAGDLDVIGRHPWTTPRRVGSGEVDGRPSVHIACDGWCVASATTSSTGDLVIASATTLDHAALDEVLASVEATDEDGWQRYAEEAFGGPGLQPDEGAEEVARGTAGDLDWLLQTAPIARDPDVGTEPEPDGIEAIGIDRCLKLSDLTRACAGANGNDGPGGGWSSIAAFEAEATSTTRGSPLPTVVALRGYPVDVVAVRATGPAEPAVGSTPARPAFDVTVPVTPAPIGDGSFAVLDVDLGTTLCMDPGPIEAETGLDPGRWARVWLVDADGDEVDCLGLGG